MNWMHKLERKWGRNAVFDLHKYFVFAFFIGFVMNHVNPSVMSFFTFSVDGILHGQIWRILTWVFVCPSKSMMTLLFMLCLIPMGRTLEHFLGVFRMNVYLFGGVLLNIVGGILVYIITKLTLGIGFPVYLSTYYILLSIFMAMAICVPDATVNLYFILPIKMKWMLALYLGELAYELFTYYRAGGMVVVAVYGSQIIFALLNLYLFFYFSKVHLTGKQKKRQREFKREFRTNVTEPRPGSGITRHKCAICGRTELDDPTLTFRYCSKCTGNKEYCNNHLFTHEHR